MKESAHSSDQSARTIASASLRATAAGTERFAQRHHTGFAEDHFRSALGLTISSVGIGTYLGESTDQDDAAYRSAIRRAVESGINLIDTAINYRSQRSERTVGTVLQELFASGAATRDELVVCSKGGYIPLEGAPPASREEYQAFVEREYIATEILRPSDIVAGAHSLAPRFLRYCLAKSRQNLGLRTIDLYYLHNPGQQLVAIGRDELMSRIRGAFTVLEEAAERGEIGAYGIATWDELRVPPGERGHLELEEIVAVAREAGGERHHFRAVQLPINLAMTEAARVPTQTLAGRAMPALEAAQALGLTVVASASLLQAKLASGLPEQVRSHFPGLETDAQRALAFVRGLDGVATALVGTKQAAHVEENLRAARV